MKFTCRVLVSFVSLLVIFLAVVKELVQSVRAVLQSFTKSVDQLMEYFLSKVAELRFLTRKGHRGIFHNSLRTASRNASPFGKSFCFSTSLIRRK